MLNLLVFDNITAFFSIAPLNGGKFRRNTIFSLFSSLPKGDMPYKLLKYLPIPFGKRKETGGHVRREIEIQQRYQDGDDFPVPRIHARRL
jgi:hypothetical protein